MTYILAILIAALSYIVNHFLVKYIGILTVVSFSPILEETFKTLFSYYCGVDILLTHIMFGIIEGFWDIYGKANVQFGPAVISIIGHTLFGFVTINVHVYINIYPALFAAILVHWLWNNIAVTTRTKI